MRTRAVDRHKAQDYLKRAKECKNSMNHSYEECEWNSCVINAVHSAIAAADAFCIWKTGIRHAGERHEEAVRLFSQTDSQDRYIRNASRHLQELLSIKSNAEYGEKLMTEKSATLAKKHAERLFDFIQSRIQNY